MINDVQIKKLATVSNSSMFNIYNESNVSLDSFIWVFLMPVPWLIVMLDESKLVQLSDLKIIWRKLVESFNVSYKLVYIKPEFLPFFKENTIILNEDKCNYNHESIQLRI